MVVAVALLATWNSRRQGVERPVEPVATTSKPASFDFYLLALTSHPAFCADGHSRKAECRAGASVPISIHGLWPERLEPGRYPRDCNGPPLDLRPDSAAQLARLMPGMADGLHEHEWRKHGTCTGLDDDVYFSHLYVLSLRVVEALGDRLTTLAGRSTSAAQLREFADDHEAGMGATLTFHCRTLREAPREHRQEPYLVEIRQCFDNTGPDGRPGLRMDCATVKRRDQGCGKTFRIAS
jgi:ribonuclease I